ncbi:hypothetical protein AYI70_g11073 [Smittium culicis]|uniref:Uncharacterized protein n=1 Tax=Smittium culicis TaxID=133412 RepID=A0A1R1X3I1_9FUNG|nr:hypothetical protein AYI70_g11073 [Smittium culicis]
MTCTRLDDGKISISDTFILSSPKDNSQPINNADTDKKNLDSYSMDISYLLNLGELIVNSGIIPKIFSNEFKSDFKNKSFDSNNLLKDIVLISEIWIQHKATSSNIKKIYELIESINIPIDLSENSSQKTLDSLSFDIDLQNKLIISAIHGLTKIGDLSNESTTVLFNILEKIIKNYKLFKENEFYITETITSNLFKSYSLILKALIKGNLLSKKLPEIELNSSISFDDFIEIVSMTVKDKAFCSSTDGKSSTVAVEFEAASYLSSILCLASELKILKFSEDHMKTLRECFISLINGPNFLKLVYSNKRCFIISFICSIWSLLKTESNDQNLCKIDAKLIPVLFACYSGTDSVEDIALLKLFRSYESYTGISLEPAIVFFGEEAAEKLSKERYTNIHYGRRCE